MSDDHASTTSPSPLPPQQQQQQQQQQSPPLPQIDLESEHIKAFLTQFNAILQNGIRTGVDAEQYDLFWQMMGNRDLATLYLTVFMGKLLQMENNALQLMLSSRMTTMAPQTQNAEMMDGAAGAGGESSTGTGSSSSSSNNNNNNSALNSGQNSPVPDIVLVGNGGGRESIGDVSDAADNTGSGRPSNASDTGVDTAADISFDINEVCKLYNITLLLLLL